MDNFIQKVKLTLFALDITLSSSYIAERNKKLGAMFKLAVTPQQNFMKISHKATSQFKVTYSLVIGNHLLGT